MVANTVCTVCELDRGSLGDLNVNFPEVILAMQELAMKRKGMDSMDKAVRALPPPAPKHVEVVEEHVAHKHGGTKLPGMGKAKHGGHDNGGGNKMQWAEEILVSALPQFPPQPDLQGNR